MKYRITIEKIEVKKVLKSVYSSEAMDRNGEKGGLIDVEATEVGSEKIYDQIINHEIDLSTVIRVINEDPTE